MRKPDPSDETSDGFVSVLMTDQKDKPELNGAPSEVLSVLKVSVAALSGFAVLYLIFFSLSIKFPYFQPGDNLVKSLKHAKARRGNLFQSKRGSPTGDPRQGRMHVIAFGYSKTLAGFIPQLFDSELAAAGFPAVESYNFGLPGDNRFVADLEAMAAHGTAPDIALLTAPWPAFRETGPTFFHFINDDQQVMDNLFPFRYMPRNVSIMLADAHGLGGLAEVYMQSERAVRQVWIDRGYYFIARQSHFKNDELPADYRLPTDTPDVIDPRVVPLGPVYEHLARVLAKNKIQCIFIPRYYREGEFAEPAALNSATARVLANQPNVALMGPDYWIYPNRLFSDQDHANRAGAAVYTRAVAGLIAQWMAKNPRKIGVTP